MLNKYPPPQYQISHTLKENVCFKECSIYSTADNLQGLGLALCVLSEEAAAFYVKANVVFLPLYTTGTTRSDGILSHL